MITSTSEYALRAAVHLAALHGGEGGAANAERIAAATQVPAGYLSKVMRDLVVAGLVLSQRGPNGGFALARAPKDITVLDVVNAVCPIQRIRACPLGNPKHVQLCPLHRRLDEAIAGIEQAFSGTSLAELLEGAPQRHAASGGTCVALTVGRHQRNGAAESGSRRPEPARRAITAPAVRRTERNANRAR